MNEKLLFRQWADRNDVRECAKTESNSQLVTLVASRATSTSY